MNSRVMAGAVIVALNVFLPSRTAAQEAVATSYWDITTSGTAEFAAAIAVGADSHPVVADTVCGSFGGPGCQARAIKYNGDTGAVVWTFVDTAGGSTVMAEAAGIAIGADGNPVMASTQCDSAGLNCLIVAVKINGTSGGQVWRNTSPAATTSDFAKAVSIGVDGHAVVAGAICTEPGTSDCDGKVIKFNGTTGAILWNITRTSTYQMLFGVAVITDVTNQNNVIVTGIDCAATTQNCNFITTQLSGAAGALVGTARTFNSSEPLAYISELGWSVAIGTDADPVVTGVSCLAATGCDFRTIKYSSIGLSATTTYNVTFNSSGTNGDATLGGGVAIAGDNRPVVVGSTCTTAYPNCVGRIRKLSGATPGAAIWDGTFGAAATALQGVATGPDANPVVAGYQCTGAACSSRVSKRLLQYTTAAGTNLDVAVNGDRGVANGARVSFATVSTAGSTSLVLIHTGPAPPAGVTFIGSRYFQVATTAVVTGNRTVCLNYGSFIDGTESTYQIYRRNNANTAWETLTPTREPITNYICGPSANGLGLYAIGRP